VQSLRCPQDQSFARFVANRSCFFVIEGIRGSMELMDPKFGCRAAVIYDVHDRRESEPA